VADLSLECPIKRPTGTPLGARRLNCLIRPVFQNPRPATNVHTKHDNVTCMQLIKLIDEINWFKVYA